VVSWGQDTKGASQVTFTVSALAAAGAAERLEFTAIERRAPGPHDVVIDIAYTGICHTDIALLRNEWMEGVFPWCRGTRSPARSWPSAPASRATRWGTGSVSAPALIRAGSA
jgi:hypothetical protein